MRRKFIYPGFERFWHWSQAGLILLLAVTGFEIHGSLTFFGFRQAVRLHELTAYAFIALIVFAIFWHLTTDQWRNYLPTFANIRAYVNYYVIGIFRREPHPTHRNELSKLNPLQKLVYAGLKALVIPVMGVTGLIALFYRYPQRYEVISLNVSGLQITAALHTMGAYLLVAFFVAHIYLITTGASITANLKAMVTGYEDIAEKDSSTDAELKHRAA